MVDTINQIGDMVCKDYLGFEPTSNSVKPPHIANGIFREVSHEVCDSHDVHEWIVSENKDNALSSEEIVEKYRDILALGEREAYANIKQLRALFNDVFNPDHTVYPDYNFSVANISSRWLVKKRVNSEVGIGHFIYNILIKEINGEISPAVKLIKEALAKDTDDLTKIIKPIISFPSEAVKRSVFPEELPLELDISWNECKQVIRNGFDNLARNLEQTGESRNSLIVLERIVNFSCFALFFYLININSYSKSTAHIPILLDGGADAESIKKASEQCYSFGKTAVEEFFIESICAILSKEISTDDNKKCKEWIDNITIFDKNNEDEILEALNNYFSSFCSDGENPIHALSHAIQIVLYTFRYKKNSSPSEFCRVLGVRSGLVGPRGNSAKIKRFLANSFMLETLTYSILAIDDIIDGIELKDLSKKFSHSYNILLGADVDHEYKILEDYNIAQSTPGDLRGDMILNAQKIGDTFISLGLGHRYADGVTMIGRKF